MTLRTLASRHDNMTLVGFVVIIELYITASKYLIDCYEPKMSKCTSTSVPIEKCIKKTPF